MKASEMTNEELADYIVNVIGGGIFKEYYAEAASRLLEFDITLVAQKAKAAAEGYAHGCEEVADLRRRLKVAERSLVRLKGICDQIDYSYGRSICDEALAAIREERSAK